PPAPGKWTPSQIVEHVARSMEEAANLGQDKPNAIPRPPSILRPLARLIFKRPVKSGEFPKPRTKTTRELDPPSGPASPAEARSRLEAAFATFERACRARVAAGQPVVSPAFGRVEVADYARFTAAHTRHHTKQIPMVM